MNKISIKDFRLFSNFNLTLNRGLNVIVGENDSGKTALIDAIRFALGTTSSEKSYIQISDFKNNLKEFTITLKFVELDSFAHVFLEHLTHEETEPNKSEAVLYVTLRSYLSEKEKRGYPFIKSEFRSGENGNGLIFDSELRYLLASTYLKPLRDAEEELSSGRGSRLSQILSSSKALKAPESINAILTLIADTNNALIEDGKPISMTSKLIREKYLHKLIFEDDKEKLQAIIDIAGVKDITGLSQSEKKKYLRYVLESLNLSLSSVGRNHGLGYHNLLFMAAELLLLEQETEVESSLLLIEEPEAHIHPQLQMKLLDFLNSNVQTVRKKGIQCILTTHSPNLASRANLEEIIIMNKGKAFSLRSSETGLSASDYLFLKKFLDVTKSNLLFARGVLIVEGDAENILLPTIAKLLGRPLENHGVSIVNVGSTAWKRFAKIFIRSNKDQIPEEWLPVKVAVLRDLDLWPDCAEKNETNLYGFKERLDGNQHYWESAHEDLANHKNSKKDSLEKQNVKIFISDKWTLEFCLASFGLFEECYEAIHSTDAKIEEISNSIMESSLTVGTEENLNGLTSNEIEINNVETEIETETVVLNVATQEIIDPVPGNLDEKSTYIIGKALSSKTDLSQKLAIILESKYKDRVEDFRAKLPPYIVEAIEYLTTTTTTTTT